MKKVGVIASSLAFVASFGLGHLYLGRLEAEASGGPKISVLVAAKDVGIGEKLKEELLVEKEIPQAYLEDRHIKANEIKKVIGARVSGGLKANESILWSDLAQFGDQHRVLSGLVTQGMRAVTIDGRDVDFGGLLRPGDRVDILLTTGADDNSTTRTILQNLWVLSVGDNIAQPDEMNANRRNRGNVTLSATVESAQVLAQARRLGQLSLTLRNSEDNTVVEGLPEASKDSIIERLLRETTASAPSAANQASSRKRVDHVH